MSQFAPPPIKVLETRDDLLAHLGDIDRADIRSEWLVSLIAELESGGRVYNAQVKALAHERLGLGTLTHEEAAREGDQLSWLIYKAQQYRRSDKLTAAGYVPFTAAVLEAAREGGLIGFHQSNAFEIVVNGEKVEHKDEEVLKVRRIGDKLYAMMPRSRTKAATVKGQPCRIVKQG